MCKYFHEEKANTLVNGTCPGHHNGIVTAMSFRYRAGAKARSLGIGDDVSPTIASQQLPAVCAPKSIGFAWQAGSDASLCIGDEISPTLRAVQTPAVCGVVAIEGNGTRESHRGNGYKEAETMYTLNTTEQHKVAYAVENHPGDSRMKLADDNVVQALTSRMGTGGGNTPMVLQQTPFVKTHRATSKEDSTTWANKEVSNTLNAFDVGETRCNELVVEAIGVDMYNQDLTGDKSSTIGTNCGMSAGRNGVMTYSFDRRNQSLSKETMNTITAEGGGDNQPTVFVMGSQQGNTPIGEDLCPTITAMAGMSGNNQPVAFIPKAYGVVSKGNGEAWLTEEKHMSLSVGGGQAGQGYPCVVEPKDIFAIDQDTGKSVNYITKNITPCLSTGHAHAVFVPCVAEPKAYNIGSYTSNAMLSSNPHSGIYETQISKTLDASGPNPDKNQGGTVILQPTTYIDGWGGNMEKVFVDDKMNTLRAAQPQVVFQPTGHAACVGVDVYNQTLTGDISKTLNSAASDSDHVPCVCMETGFFSSFVDVAPTLKARDYTDPQVICANFRADGIEGNGKSFCIIGKHESFVSDLTNLIAVEEDE